MTAFIALVLLYFAMRLILKTHTSASQLNSMTNPTFADISRTSGSLLVFWLLNNYGLFVTFSVLIRRYVDEQQSKFALAKKKTVVTKE